MLSDRAEDWVQWMLPMISLIPEESLSKLKMLFGIKFQKSDKDKGKIIAFLTKDLSSRDDHTSHCKSMTTWTVHHHRRTPLLAMANHRKIAHLHEG